VTDKLSHGDSTAQFADVTATSWLVFESERAVRLVRHYAPDRRAFSDEAREDLSWGR